jgi:hypothetical protein
MVEFLSTNGVLSNMKFGEYKVKEIRMIDYNHFYMAVS